MVLAAGLGTRLRPLTESLPKPAVPVANRPLALRSVHSLAAGGASWVALNTHHLSDRLLQELGPTMPTGMHVRFIRETTLLGTGGGIRNAAPSLEDDELFVVMNGDILFAPDLSAAIAHHKSVGALATMVVRPDPRAFDLGSIEIDEGGVVRRMLGRPEHHGAPLSAMMFTGVHILSKEAVAKLPHEGCVVQKGYRWWLDEGETIGGFVDHNDWRDLGTHAAYLQANIDLARGVLKWPGVQPDDSQNIIDPRAKVEAGARVSNSVVGAKAIVRAGASLDECVVWPGAVVTRQHQRAIISPAHNIAVG